MMQLAKALHLKGFSIIVAQTKFSYFSTPDDFTDFQFITILESLPESDLKNLEQIRLALKLNKECQHNNCHGISLSLCIDKPTASSVIINTASCLESSSLSCLQESLEIPVYPIGPLHMMASAPSSLLEENKSCIEWLNKQKQNSVIF
ncbi:unnamed protein product [Eruca vesicaria subsp. sativa]|uniref:Uncharacterized protein n=1 Tax=Eruca vesicaria subsp. sativa TaxID=29727 RepID=A0ABC8KHT4_ERUVS|nr:unnamed protein product [Eruca vesicaria subsp. sativa]